MPILGENVLVANAFSNGYLAKILSIVSILRGRRPDGNNIPKQPTIARREYTSQPLQLRTGQQSNSQRSADVLITLFPWPDECSGLPAESKA